MVRLIMVVVVLALLAVAGLSAYAYLADLSPATSETKVPVTLHAD